MTVRPVRQLIVPPPTRAGAVDRGAPESERYHLCNVANVPAAILLRGAGKKVVLNVDGLEWQRAKWGALGRTYYRVAARLAARLPIELVTDARVIQRHYRREYGRETAYAHVVLAAFAGVRTDLALAVVGDAPYAGEYIAGLRRAAASDPRVRLLGGRYGHAYHVLRSHAAAYVQATEVGGTHPALVEAMGFGNAITANDVPEHREVLDDAGLYYRDTGGLTAAFQRLLDEPALAAEMRARASRRAPRSTTRGRPSPTATRHG
jgi:hypothetical protein